MQKAAPAKKQGLFHLSLYELRRQERLRNNRKPENITLTAGKIPVIP